MRPLGHAKYGARKKEEEVVIVTQSPSTRQYPTQTTQSAYASDTDKMMDRMMNIMQQSMQHNQFMNQQMQQSQMMQYGQMLQPGLQQHTIQNQIMLQNAQIQNMINQRFAIAATAQPPPPRPPMPPYDSKAQTLSMYRSPMIKLPTALDKPEEEKETETIMPTDSGLGKLEPFEATDALPAEIPMPSEPTPPPPPPPPPAEKPKLPGKEISQKPFETLNKQFKARHPEIYVDKRFQAPVVFLRPERDSSKLELRLESIFNAKVVKYLPGEWEALRPTE